MKKKISDPCAWAVVVIAATTAAMFVLRFGGPTDLMDFAQELPTAYTLDLVHNHHWIVQWDNNDDISSKPPMHTWLAAICSWALGGVSKLSLCLPSGLAVFGTALILFFSGRRLFGERAGFFAAMGFLLSISAFKAVTLVRVDPVFALGVTLGSLLFFHAWQSSTGWTGAWVVAAIVTLTKGPLGVVLAIAGLLAVFWKGKADEPQPAKGSQWKGLLLYCLIVGGWFWLAWRQAGHQLPEKLFAKELLHHAVTNGAKQSPGQHAYNPALYFLSRFAPWSIFSCIGFWRVVKRPALHLTERRFERFLFCWFFVGLLLFSVTPHQRGDLLWPILPAAALLAGRELAQLTRHWKLPRLALATSTAGAIMFALSGWEYYYYRADREQNQQARAVMEFAEKLKRPLNEGVVLTHVRSSSFLHLCLGTFSANVSVEEAAALLQQQKPVFVVINNPARLRACMGESPSYLVAEGPKTGFTHLQLVSNYPSAR